MRTNEVIRVLMAIASIFIPLTFIAGVYGMNFDRSTSGFNMPELGWRFGYLYAIGLMVAVAFGMITFLKLKKWL